MKHTRTIIAAVAAAAALGGLYWYATGGAHEAAPSWVTTSPIAHRGLWGSSAPENSLAAFRAAVEEGYPVELDVHLSSDGEVVVMHDDDLERMTGDAREVSEVTLAELRKLRLADTDEPVPTLAEALEAVGGRVPMFVEVKNDGAVGPLEEAVADEIDGYDGELALISFNPNSLARLAKLAPGVTRGQLSGTFDGEDLAGYKKFVLRHLLMNWTSKPAFIAYELEALPAPGVRLQRMRGRPLLAWTAETDEDVERAERHADAVIAQGEAIR